MRDWEPSVIEWLLIGVVIYGLALGIARVSQRLHYSERREFEVDGVAYLWVPPNRARSFFTRPWKGGRFEYADDQSRVTDPYLKRLLRGNGMRKCLSEWFSSNDFG